MARPKKPQPHGDLSNPILMDNGGTIVAPSVIKIGLRSGGVIIVTPDTVDVSQLTLNDIAYGLANIPRFSGQMDRPYSVCEHSIILSELCGDDYNQAIAALFHDTAECLGIGDINTFLKSDDMRDLEDRINKEVTKKFKIPPFVRHDLDKALGNYEACTIHPAKGHFGPPPQLPGVRYRHYRSVSDCAEAWKTLYQVYLDSREFAQLPIPVNGLRPNVPFSIQDLYSRFPGILPSAVKKALELNPTIRNAGGDNYVLNS